MKYSCLLLLPILWLCSCKEKAANSAASPSAPAQKETAANSDNASQPTQAGAPSPAQATSEQLASTLRVRVAFGGLPPREGTAALLHRDEIPNKLLVQGKDRFVLALLQGWEEGQLRGDASHIFVYRNKVNPQGAPVTTSSPAHLIHIDPATGLALLTYRENFPYSQEAGFHLQRDASAHSELAILRSLTSTPNAQASLATSAIPAQAPFSTSQPSDLPLQFSVDAGAYHGASGNQGAAQLPPLAPTMHADPVQLAVAAPDSLAGFITEGPAGAATMTPVGNVDLNIQTSLLKAASITFENQNAPFSVGFDLVIQATPSNLVPSRVNMRIREDPDVTLEEAAQPNADGAFPFIQTKYVTELRRAPNTMHWKGSFTAPDPGKERVFLVQITWPILHDNPANIRGATFAYGKPFLVKLARRPDGVYPTVEGLGDAGPAAVAKAPASPAAPGVTSPAAQSAVSPGAAEAPATFGEAKTFPLESPVLNVHLLAGGRESLLQLQGAPFWKRFSFEKNDWLPLPPGDLSNACLTGNLSALFLLDRTAGEVRKYALADLQETGKTKLPEAPEYFAVLAGCDSDHAPVHVLLSKDALALAPETLQRRDVSRSTDLLNMVGERKFSREDHYQITGDGLAFQQLDGTRSRWYFYNSDVRGIEATYLGLANNGSEMGYARGISGAFFRNLGELSCLATSDGKPFKLAALPSNGKHPPVSLAENCPVYFSLRPADTTTAPPQPPRLQCFSYFVPSPFAEVDVPELGGMTDLHAFEKERQVFLDPYSLRLATVAADKKSWVVRQLTAPEKRNQPILLNWPDTSLVRGGEFRFTPRLLGGDQFSAEISGQPEKVAVDAASGVVQYTVAPEEFASLQLLNLKVPGKGGGGISPPIPLQVFGPEMPFAARPIANREGLNSRGTAFKSLGDSTQGFYPLRSTLHQFASRVVEMEGPVAGYLALVTQGNRIDLLSLQNRKITGSIDGSLGAYYYVGAGALFEYDPQTRTLTRISVPDGRHEQTLTLPSGVALQGIGLGTEPGSPVTLACNITQGVSTLAFADVTITLTDFRSVMVVLDGKTLKSTGWAQPVSLAHMLNQPEQDGNLLGTLMIPPDSRPVNLPVSHNGCIVSLERYFFALSPTYAVAYPFAGASISTLFSQTTGYYPSGSISGMMAISPSGQPFKGGMKVGDIEPGKTLGASPCGRYRMNELPAGPDQDGCMEVRLTENDKPLMLVARVPFFQNEIGSQHVIQRRFCMVGDAGPLAILSPSGRALELVDFDIPAMMKTLAPEEFHVTSQAVPCVVAGGTLQYQVQVNNPDAVQTYRLQTEVPGASISPQGLLRYNAPGRITGPTQTNIAIEIIGKAGQTVSHKFPVFILPSPKATGGLHAGPI